MADLEDIEALAVFAELFEAGGLTADEFRIVKFQILGTDHPVAANPTNVSEMPTAPSQVQSPLKVQETQFMVVLQLDANWESDRERIALLIAEALDDSIEDVLQVLVDQNAIIAVSPDRKEAEKAIIDLAGNNISAYLKMVQPSP